MSYLYLSIVYSGYPFLIKALVPKKYRGIAMKEMTITKVSAEEKLAFSIVTGTVLSLLFPVAAPLFVSFFRVIIRESKVTRYMFFADEIILTGSTLFLGFFLGCLLSADVVVEPTMFKLLILGFFALFISGVGGLLGVMSCAGSVGEKLIRWSGLPGFPVFPRQQRSPISALTK